MFEKNNFDNVLTLKSRIENGYVFSIYCLKVPLFYWFLDIHRLGLCTYLMYLRITYRILLAFVYRLFGMHS